MTKSCAWCEHHRLGQIMCPKCNLTIDILDQIICVGCLYSEIMFSGNVIYCLICNEYFADEYDNCLSNNHSIIKDKKLVIEKIIKDYPQSRDFFKFLM